MNFHRKKYFPVFLILLSWIAVGIFFYLIVPLPVENLNRYGKLVLAENGKILRTFLTEDQQWCFPPSTNTDIPKKLQAAVLNYEDRFFYAHQGINIPSLIRAFYLNLKSGKIVSGGSTITMQVARIMDPKPRTLTSKLIEILQAFKLEIIYSKKAILRFYLDNAPYGGNIRGIRAASLKYFGKEPLQLSWGETAVLAVLPNTPGLITPGSRHDQLLKKRNRLLEKLADTGFITKETLITSKLEPIPTKSRSFPWLSPHLARKLSDKVQENIISTTIDYHLQGLVESILKQHSVYLQYHGIANISCLVVDNETGWMKVYCGSQDFNDSKNQGQVDGVMASRSPGSTLKPFLYALSIDAGMIVPQTLMQDVPTFFGPFQPENADGNYSGLVTAKEALIRSLNVPAVRLLNLYGIKPFYNFLKASGTSTLFRNPDDYGLTLIIGGCEMKLFELVRLYRGLANYGSFSDLILLRSDKKSAPELQLISPGASYLILDVLKELNRPGSEYYWHQYENQYPLAWKTGTSFGQRDAWAIGVNPQWTIGVWVGNFQGDVNPSLSGAASAAPVLFDIFNTLPHDPDKIWFQAPVAEMDAIKICKDTGFLAGPDCLETEIIMVPDRMHALRICPYHRKIFLNDDETRQVCSLCWEPEHYHCKKVLVYPPKILHYLRERGDRSFDLPPHREDCPAASDSRAIRIIYPGNSALIWLPRDLGGVKQKITCRVAHSDPIMLLYWYLDDQYLGTTENDHSKAISPDRGTHLLKVIDRNGDWAEVRFDIDFN